MDVVEEEQQKEAFEMITDLRIRASIPWPVLEAARNRSRGPKGREGVGLLEVMCDPYEWKSAVRFALVIFVGFAALAPALAPDQTKLAAQINHQTLKAAAAIKGTDR